MPTPTDLVTDLPADFEVFGQAVDSSMADLKGGTTGQILSKATNTDMDFVWITNDQGDITGITATSPLTGGGTSGAVTVGIQSATTSQSGAVQLSDSTSTTSSVLAATPTAVKSAYDLANRPNPSNPVINSAFQIWQRGTSVAASAGSSTYTADRWSILSAGNATTTSRQATSDTTNLPFIQYCARVQRNAGQTSTQAIYYGNSFETINSLPFVGKTVTLSYYARAGANYSGASNGLTVVLYSGTGTDQSITGTYTGASAVATSSATLTTTWQRFTATGTVSSSATELAVSPFYTPSGTAGANDYFEITGVQIDVGSSALPFRTAGTTYQQELAACQRYYWRVNTNSTNTTTGLYGSAYNTTAAAPGRAAPVTMRVVPTSMDYSNQQLNDFAGTFAVTGVALWSGSSTDSLYVLATGATGLTTGRSYGLTASGTGYIGFSAEL